MSKLDPELAALGRLALANAFYNDFSDLLNNYLKHAEGLDPEAFRYQIGDMTSVFGINPNTVGDSWLNLYVQTPFHSFGCDTMLEALTEIPDAIEVWLNGEKIFIRNSEGEWIWNENK